MLLTDIQIDRHGYRDYINFDVDGGNYVALYQDIYVYARKQNYESLPKPY